MTFENDWVLLGARDPERRYRAISVSPDLFASIFGGGFSDVFPEEPVADLRIVAARVLSWRNTIEFLVASESFEPLHESVESMSVTWAPRFTKRVPS